jgi:dihydroorotate dehydrogenase (fumarate)
MPDLQSRYLGLRLRSPLVASSSPLTGRLATLRQLEDAGAGAVVLPSLFEEQLTAESLEIDRSRRAPGASARPSTTFPTSMTTTRGRTAASSSCTTRSRRSAFR